MLGPLVYMECGEMRQTDLEFHRWKFHNLTKLSKNKRHRHCSWRCYWQEHGAFGSLLPRQSGKTNLILDMIGNIKSRDEDYLLAVLRPQDKIRMLAQNRCSLKIGSVIHGAEVDNRLCGRCNSVHLFVDEFAYFNDDHLRKLLDNPWKSVTMVSSISIGA